MIYTVLFRHCIMLCSCIFILYAQDIVLYVQRSEIAETDTLFSKVTDSTFYRYVTFSKRNKVA